MSFDFDITAEEWNEFLDLREKGFRNCNDVEKKRSTDLQTMICLSTGECKDMFVKFLNHEGELHKI